MKRLTTAAVACMAGLLLFAFTSAARAEDKEMTITGEGKCAKCSLKESDKCQTVIVQGKGEKAKKYFVVQNDIAKEFHSNICHESKMVKAIGTVKKDADGKLEFTATKIEVVKKGEGKEGKEKE